jgi:hypothetical protein
MEDEGHLSDHQSGVSATDGNWHHIAVTWESRTGKLVLYDNGRPVWQVRGLAGWPGLAWPGRQLLARAARYQAPRAGW